MARLSEEMEEGGKELGIITKRSLPLLTGVQKVLRRGALVKSSKGREFLRGSSHNTKKSMPSPYRGEKKSAHIKEKKKACIVNFRKRDLNFQ